ncbi:MAG: outer membrane protein assembly factor BamD [Hyphomicrobiaceae bacterium]
MTGLQSSKGRQARWATRAVLLAVVALGGCASNKDAKLLNPDPPAKMYADADTYLSKGRYEDAAKKFEDLDRDHPYAAEARRAMVLAAYAYYKAGQHPEAIAAAKRYTTLHPGTKDAALAHHVIASSYFDQIKDPAHDQSSSKRALAELKVLVTRYGDSPYARQAENRIRIAEDSIAANEMYVGRYYLKKRNYVAAINRFRVVVTEYQTTQQVEEALHRLAEAYTSLGVMPEAQNAAAVLGHNYPNSQWYKRSYALLQKEGVKPQINAGSWLSQQMQKVVPGPASKPPPPEQTLPPQPEQIQPGTPPAQQKVAPQDIPTASTTPRKGPMGLTRTF